MIIGLDVGGTHTDVVLLRPSGIHAKAKVPTDHSDLVGTITKGVDTVLSETPPEAVTRVVLSTTLTTNAVVESLGADVGMLVAAGPGMDPALFAIGPSYHVVKGALDHRGSEIAPPDPKEIESVVASLKGAGIRHLGIVTKFSVRNPAHERLMERLAAPHFETVFCGHRISGNLNFPRRIASCWLNATVAATFQRFHDAVAAAFSARKIDAPIHILKADGGTLSLSAAAKSPGETVLSGPSASVMGAIPYAEKKGDTLVLDIGGTTTDMAILIDRVPVLEPLGASVGGVRTLFRALQSVSVGLGGDSTVRVKDGVVTIGPDRSGPAACLGGPQPTPTDAMAVLGAFPDGDRGLAQEAVGSIAKELGGDLVSAANAILDALCDGIFRQAKKMVTAINSRPVYTLHEMLTGYTVAPAKILVLGGPAGVLADRIRNRFGITTKAVTDWEVANAVGAGMARPTCSVTVFADTEKGRAEAPEEDYGEKISASFTKEDALGLANTLLEKKAERIGANPLDMATEVVEALAFPMVRGYRRSGSNIRVRVQLQPGLIRDYDTAQADGA